MAQQKKSDNTLLIVFVIVIILSLLAIAALLFWQKRQTAQLPQNDERTAQTAPQTDAPQPSADARTAQTAPQTDAPQPASAEHTASTAAVPATAVSAVPAGDGLIQLPLNLAVPRCAAHDHAADHELRHFADYDICYRESYEQAEWSAYQLERAELTKNASRTDDFRPDPNISTGSAALADYRKSGYDRGHLAPAADFAYSQEAMSETFFLSNMTPQSPQFNRGIWKDLEEQVRTWAREYGRVYVICGPVFDEPADAYETIGTNRVAIPRYFYKIVLIPHYADEADFATPDDCADLIAYAYIIPNKKCDDGFASYRTTIDDVEAKTGIDFLYLLDDATEARVEAMR